MLWCCKGADSSSQRLSDLKNINNELDKCQKSMSEYLDTKKNAFPRFFFISADNLLSIIGSSNPRTI